MAPSHKKRRVEDSSSSSVSSSTHVDVDNLETHGKLLNILLKNLGILNGKFNSLEDKVDEILKLHRETTSAEDDLSVKLTVLAEGQSRLIKAGEAFTSSSPASSIAMSSPGQPAPIKRKLTYASLFTGEKSAEGILWGMKIGTVFFRQLNMIPYATEHELLDSFLEYKGGILSRTVKEWFAANRIRIRTAFRDKRCSYMKTVKTYISHVMQVDPPPAVTKSSGGASKTWREETAETWKALKVEAFNNGYAYPTEVTDIALSIAQLWDKNGNYTTDLLTYERPGNSACIEDSSFNSIVTLEALTLLCCEVTFCLVDSSFSSSLCGSEALDQAVVAVLDQRVKVELIQAAAAITAENSSDSD